MPEKKKYSTYTHDKPLGMTLSTEDDIEGQDDYYEEPEDYFISDGKKIQKIKRRNKREKEEDWD